VQQQPSQYTSQRVFLAGWTPWFRAVDVLGLPHSVVMTSSDQNILLVVAVCRWYAVVAPLFVLADGSLDVMRCALLR
jgi:hypothetical protein